MTDAERDAFYRGYTHAMIWANAIMEDPDLEPPFHHPGDFEDAAAELAAELSDRAKAELRQHCDDFLDDDVTRLIDAAIERDAHYSYELAGHDFALTRNRHGAGFWDRGLGDIGDELTQIAHGYGGALIFISNPHRPSTWTVQE